MKRAIWMDMDGTIADFYGVEGWLEALKAESVKPYKEAKGLVNLQALARRLNRMNRKGYEINIISWGSKNASEAFNEEIAKAKIGWLKKHLASVNFKNIDIVPYGTPKGEGREGILFDDEEANRNGWGYNEIRYAMEAEGILEALKIIEALEI